MSAYFDAPPPPADMTCEQMTAPQCVQSPKCVLAPPRRGAFGQYIGGDYICRDAAGPCEGGVAQHDTRFQSDCATRPHCVFQGANCFCLGETKVPSGITGKPACACGGGPTQMCTPEPTVPCKLSCPKGFVDYSCGALPSSTLVSKKCPDGTPAKVSIGFDKHVVECEASCTGSDGTCHDDTGAHCSF